MRLLPFEEIYSLNYYDEFMGAEIEFIDNFGWRMIDYLTPNLISVFSCVFISPVLRAYHKRASYYFLWCFVY